MASTLGAFAYRRRLTIDTTSAKANIASSLTSFPVCVAVNATSWGAVGAGHFFDSSNASGKRVQFFDSSGTNLAYEVEQYDSANQLSIYWVAITVTGNSTTTIDVGYGSDPNGADQNQTTSVWDSDFRRIYHLGDSPTADSTSNNISLSGTVTTGATGMVGKAIQLNGTSHYYSGSDTGLQTGTGARTVSMWVKGTNASNGAFHDCFFYGSAATGQAWIMGYDNVGKWFWSQYGAGYSPVAYTQNAWVYLATYGSGGSSATTVVNTTSYNGTSTYSTVLAGSTGLLIGARNNGPVEFFPGYVDEVRVSNVNRSADWLRGEYYSTFATSWNGDGWLTVGAEQFRARGYLTRQAVNRAAIF